MSGALNEDLRTFYFWRRHKFALDTFRKTLNIFMLLTSDV
jgi:hypothetical protein